MTAPSVLVRNEISRFLRTAEPEVLCISGAWGVGKTYLWKDALVQVAKVAPPLPDYSYVSLFGVDSLEDLRLAIFANRVSLAPGRVAKARMWSLSRAKSAQTLLEQVPKVGPLFKALGAMYFSSVRGMVVCIDDLERRSKNLQIRDVFGLISFLKEERNCRIVLLLNDGELENGIEEFRNYFEKTIDVHLRFAPSAEESAAIAFPNSDELGRSVTKYCVALGIRNIRIIKKIERAARGVQPFMQGLDQEVIQSAIRSIVLLQWTLLKGDGAPTLDYLRKRTGLTTYNFGKDSKVTPDEARWNATLDSFGWGALDELDHEIVAALEMGYFDGGKIQAAAKAVWTRLEYQRQDGNFEDAWKEYHESFDNNQDKVLDTLYTAFKQTFKTITFINLDGTVRLFRELGRNEQAEELLKFYVDSRNEPQKFWDLEVHAFGSDVKDPGVRSAIDEKFRSFGAKEVNMADLLIAMGSTGKGWNMSDVDAIAVLAIGEYKKLFKETRGRDLKRMVSGGLLANRVANPTESMKEVASNTVAALREIAAESPINARRVTNFFGVSLGSDGLKEDQAEQPATEKETPHDPG